MPQYRRKPQVVEAVQWDGKTFNNAPQWLVDAMCRPAGTPGAIFRTGNTDKLDLLYLKGPDGDNPIKANYYVVKDDNGLHVWSDVSFHMDYDRVPEFDEGP